MNVLNDAAVVAALVGAGVVAFATEIRHYVEMQRERRKALNRVLWCQLDLWSALSRYDLGDALDLVMPRIAQRFGVSETELAPFEQRETMAELIAENLLPDHRQELDQKYADSVEDLAFYEPVLAHRLSGKTDLKHFREQISSLIAAVSDRIVTQSPDPQVLRSLVTFLQKQMLHTVKSILHEDIEAVGKHLNWKTRRKIRRAMRTIKERIETDPTLPIENGADRMVLWAQTETILRTPETHSGNHE